MASSEKDGLRPPPGQGGPEGVGEDEGQGVEGEVEAELRLLPQDPDRVGGVEGLHHARKPQEEPGREVGAKPGAPQGKAEVGAPHRHLLLGLLHPPEDVPRRPVGQGPQGEEEGVAQGKGKVQAQKGPHAEAGQKGQNPASHVDRGEESGPLLAGHGLGQHLPVGQAGHGGEEGEKKKPRQENAEKQARPRPKEEGPEDEKQKPREAEGRGPAVEGKLPPVARHPPHQKGLREQASRQGKGGDEADEDRGGPEAGGEARQDDVGVHQRVPEPDQPAVEEDPAPVPAKPA